MYVPFALFLNYSSPFPWWLGLVLQVLGFGCLWATRYTGRFYPVWGRKYYLFSAVVRPVGIMLIGWAWVEILAYHELPFNLPQSTAMPSTLFIITATAVIMFIIISLYDSFLRKFFLGILAIKILLFFPNEMLIGLEFVGFARLAVMLIALSWSAWSIRTLGLRRSFLYARVDEGLVMSGPYRYHRHPQLFAALILAFFSIFMVTSRSSFSEFCFRLLNFLIMLAAVKFTTNSEEKDLRQLFAEKYNYYASRVPAMIGARNECGTPSWLRVSLISATAVLLSFISLVLMTSLPKDFPVFVGMNAYNFTAKYVTHRDLGRLTREIERKIDKQNPFPKELNMQWLESWEQWDRVRRFSPYPQTLFYCDQKYFSVDAAQITKDGKYHGFKVVQELPINLICNENQVELAQAMDYDGDGFPQVWVTRIYRHEPSDRDYFRWGNAMLAAEDERNTISPLFKDRMVINLKQRSINDAL